MTLEYICLFLSQSYMAYGKNRRNFDPYVFDVDDVAKIRSELSITVLEKNEHNYRFKKR